MPILAVTLGTKAGQKNTPVFHNWLSFAGEASYTTTGMLGLEALFEAEVNQGREILGIIAGDCGGYLPVYMPATGRVKVYYYNTDAADGPAIEVPNATDLSLVTFNVCVISQ